MSLRSRLVVGLVALSAIGLFVAAVATYGLVGKFLVGRTDQQLVDARGPMLRTLTGEILGAETGTDRPINRTLLPQVYGEIRVGGQVIAVRQSTTLAGDQAAAPALDPLPTKRLSTVGSVSGGEPHYRVLVESLGTGRTLVVALPLTDIEQTLARLARIELFVALAVLTALAGLGWWVVRLGLAPLYRMEATADAIAEGDLTRRVETPDPRTEVGRLGLALNTMLGRIETAFAEKSASEERMRRFLADASHELRTPLTSIRGYSELFRRGADTRPDDLARAMSRIESESERMGVLVEELLTLARLDEGRTEERAPVDLAALATQAADDLRVADPGRPVTVDAPVPVLVDGDEHQLRQLVGNLLANARVHTPAGTPVVVRVGTDGANDTPSGGAARRYRRPRGRRPRARHPGGGPAARLRALLPGRPGPDPGQRRRRSRPGHRRVGLHRARGHRHGAGEPRRGGAVPGPAAAVRGAGGRPGLPVDSQRGPIAVPAPTGTLDVIGRAARLAADRPRRTRCPHPPAAGRWPPGPPPESWGRRSPPAPSSPPPGPPPRPAPRARPPARPRPPRPSSTDRGPPCGTPGSTASSRCGTRPAPSSSSTPSAAR